MGKKRRAIRQAKRGEFNKAQETASQIKRADKSLETKRKISQMENTAGMADFYAKGGPVRKDSLLLKISRNK